MRVFSQINNCQQKQNKTKQKTKNRKQKNKKQTKQKGGSAFRLG